MTDTYENITFPRTMYVVCNKSLLLNSGPRCSQDLTLIRSVHSGENEKLSARRNRIRCKGVLTHSDAVSVSVTIKICHCAYGDGPFCQSPLTQG